MIKLCTWNVNSIRARFERVKLFLEREDPDILCLQELKCQETDFPFEALQEMGYLASVSGQKSYNGVAILSKVKPLEVRKGLNVGGEDPQSRFIEARFKNFWVMSVYAPNGEDVGTEKFEYKLKWFARLKEYLLRHHAQTKNLILVGDFNIAPTDLDVYDALKRKKALFCTPEERAALKELRDFGFVDVLRELYPEEKIFSWWDYRALSFAKNLGLRIDLIYASPKIQCEKSWVDRDERKGEKPSDHAPVLAQLKL